MMKKLMVLVAVCGLGAGLAQAALIDVSINGGFESGNFYGWSLFPSANDIIEIVSPGASGDFAAHIKNMQTTSGSVIKNANLLVLGEDYAPGAPVKVSFDARGAGMAGGVAFAEFFSEIDGGGVSSAEILGGGPLPLDPDPLVWTHFEFDVLTGPDTSGGLTVQFAAVTGADPNSMMDLYVDNLIVALDCVVSEESTSWGSIKTLFR
jgi:hypothetical protein